MKGLKCGTGGVGGESRASDGSLGMPRGARMGPGTMRSGLTVVLKYEYISTEFISLNLSDLKGITMKTNYTFN